MTFPAGFPNLVSFEMTRIVLLGAGASFGSGDVSPFPPPLAAQLFDELASRSGAASALPKELKASFRENFEEGMSEYFNRTDGDVQNFQRELALYMLEFEPGADNIYVRLIERLDINRCIVCTLNYDMLIELSAFKLGYGVTYSSKHNQGRLRLIKLHGSCNLWPDAPGLKGELHIRGLVKYAKVAFEGPVLCLSREEAIERSRTDKVLGPVMAVFAEGKRVTISRSYTDCQMEDWREVVSKASRICISGAKIHLPDTHIWEPLSRTKADVFYFGLKPDKDLFYEWKERSRKRNAYFFEADFAAAVPQIVRKMM